MAFSPLCDVVGGRDLFDAELSLPSEEEKDASSH